MKKISPQTIAFGIKYRFKRRKTKAAPVEQWSWKPHNHKMLEKAEPWPYAVQTNYRPSRSRQRVVLLLDSGPMMKGFLRWMKEFDLSYFCLDYVAFTEQGRVRLGLDGRNVFRIGNATLDLRDVAAVVGQWPISVRYPYQTRDLNVKLCHERWTQLMLDLKSIVSPDTIWLPSHPLNGAPEWQNKFSEYFLAKNAGFHVPETLCTNDAAEAAAFQKRWRGKILLKDSSFCASFIHPIFIQTDESFQNLENSPTVFQQHIDKEFDVRAVVVGDTVLACRIDSQASEKTKLDWRAYDNANVRWEAMKLPKRVELSMFKLMKMLDLKWSSFDFAKGKDGLYYFLEANRPGACYWLLPFAGLDVARQIVLYLRKIIR